MSRLDISNTLELTNYEEKVEDTVFDSMHSIDINIGKKYTDYELLIHPGNIENLDSALIKIERLSMQLEETLAILSPLSALRKKQKASTHKPYMYKNINPLKPAFFSIECRLSELYQFRDDIEKCIKQVESEFSNIARMSLGKLNLELRVEQRDSPMINKSLLSKTLADCNRGSETATHQSKEMDLFYRFFKDIEHQITESGKVCDLAIVKLNERKQEKKLKFVSDVENRLFSIYKAEQDTKLRELEWQIMTVNIKKSVYNDELKSLAAREKELSNFSRKIRIETVSNAKDKQKIENEIENLEQARISQEIIFNEKVESINETLEMLESCKFEVPSSVHDIILEAKSPKLMNDEIHALEKQLKDLEYEFRNSKHPESLEALQTRITKIKSSILNYKSIQVIQKSERTSSALRNNINRIDKQNDTSLDLSTHKGSFAYSGSESSLKTMKKLPQHPLPAAIRNSPLRKLEPPQKLAFNESRTPTKGKNLVQEPPRSGNMGSIRVLELILREKEEELELEEKKFQEMLMENLEDGRIVQILQKEITDYRRKRDENFKVREGLEKDRIELNDRIRQLEIKENEINEIRKHIIEQNSKFEEFKTPICEKLVWLREMLTRNIRLA